MTGPDDTDLDTHLAHKSDVDELFDKAILFVKIVGAIFASAFIWIQLSQIPVFSIFRMLDGQSLIHIALIIYYNCWIFAQPIEIRMARSVYVADKHRGRIPPPLYLAIPLLLGVGAILFWAQRDERYLAAALGVFFLVDVYFWFTMSRATSSFESASAKVYRRHHLHGRLEQLRYYVRNYLRGGWQRWRFTTIGLILLVILIVVFAPSVKHSVSVFLASLVPAFSAERISDLLPGTLFLVYVVTTEAWIWTVRLRTRRKIIHIDELAAKFKFVPLRPGKKPL